MADVILYQDPSESKVFTMDFAPLLPSTDSALADIGTSLITATNFAGTDVSSTILSSKTRTSKTLLVTIASLTLGQEYLVKFLGQGATSGQKFTMYLRVIARVELTGTF